MLWLKTNDSLNLPEACTERQKDCGFVLRILAITR